MRIVEGCLELLLCFLGIDVGDAHGKAQAQTVGIALPSLAVTFQTGHVARDAVVGIVELVDTSLELSEESVVDILLLVIDGVGDAFDISQSGFRTGDVAIGVGEHRHQVDAVDAQCSVEGGLAFLCGVDGVDEVFDGHGVVAIPEQTTLVVVGVYASGIVSHVPGTGEVLCEPSDIASVGVHEAKVAVGL